MKIKNYNEIASSALRKDALSIMEAGLQAIDMKEAIHRKVDFLDGSLVVGKKSFKIEDANRIFVVGIGKGSRGAISGLEDVLDGSIYAGIVFDIQVGDFKHSVSYVGDHPIASEKNVNITRKIIDLLEEANEDDLVIMCIAGGGSALLCQPHEMTCRQEGDIVDYLFQKGADIYELNTVRKHLSLARGGYLAKSAYPARVISLIFSDVPGNDISSVASGPTVQDKTTLKDVEKVFQKYKIEDELGIAPDNLIETPQEEKYFERVENILFLSNKDALNAMRFKAEELGYTAKICNSCLEGEARDMGLRIAEQINSEKEKTALLYGGETTVTRKEKGGKGGRSLELALSGIRKIKEGKLLLPFASDGRDNTEYAGALCDTITKKHAENLGLDPDKHIRKNLSFAFFEQTGDKVLTGPLDSNVSDLIIALSE
ncbi:MAG: DUF4147 domain-containing protein [Candidatus Spechtbacterales bacterium]|nr:DUF4147 domain-containing protein [Candidatus Spechtbacterales bacterium]